MDHTFTLTDEQESSCSQYILTQVDFTFDENLKANVPVQKWATVEAFLQDAIKSKIEEATRAFPTNAIKAKLAQIAQLEQEIKSANSVEAARK